MKRLCLAICSLWVGGAWTALAQTPADTVQLSRKLSAIVLPAIEFRSTTLPDAVEYLRQESRRLDPAGTGVNIFLAAPRNEPVRPVITLSLQRIPLLEALRYVASQAGLKVRLEPFAASLVPLSDPDAPLVTAILAVKPGFFGNAAAAPVTP